MYMKSIPGLPVVVDSSLAVGQGIVTDNWIVDSSIKAVVVGLFVVASEEVDGVLEIIRRNRVGRFDSPGELRSV